MDLLSIEQVVTNGIFTILFVWLLKTTNDRNEQREEEYRACLREYRIVLTTMGDNLGRISKDIENINKKLK